MADVTIESGLTQIQKRGKPSGHPRAFCPVWISPTTGYCVAAYDGSNDLAYYKTTDSGASWGRTNIYTTNAVWGHCIWYESWTPGDSGTLIGIVAYNTSTDTVLFWTLDTSDDSLSGPETVAASLNFTTSDLVLGHVVIGKTRADEWVVIGYDASGTSIARVRSTGGTWSDLAASPVEGAGDYYLFLPGNAADTNDFWIIHHDGSADELTLKVFDDSAGSWSEVAIASSIADSVYFGMDAAPLSDGKALLVFTNTWSTVATTIEARLIENGSTVTTLTDVDGSDEHTGVTVLVNQQNDTAYVAFGSDGYTTSVSVYSIAGTRSGDAYSWGSRSSALQESSAADFSPIGAGVAVGASGGRFAPIWVDDDNSDLETNATTSIEIAAAGGGGGGGQPAQRRQSLMMRGLARPIEIGRDGLRVA